MSRPAPTWIETNQRALAAELARVRGCLENSLNAPAPESSSKSEAQCRRQTRARKQLEPKSATQSSDCFDSSHSTPSALEMLCNGFALSPFERDLLLLCAGPELDGSFARLVAQANGHMQHRAPTWSLALSTLPEAHWSAITPGAPLRRWRILQIGAGESLASSPLRLDERILHFLAGAGSPDVRLEPLLAQISPPQLLSTSQLDVARQIARCWSGGSAPLPSIVELNSENAADHQAIAAAATAALGWQLHLLRAANVPANSDERELLARLVERETLLSRLVLLLDLHDCEPSEQTRAIDFVRTLNCPALISARESNAGLRNSVRFDIPRPDSQQQLALWKEALGPAAARLNGQLDAVAVQFQFSAPELAELAEQIRNSTDSAGDARGTDYSAVWQICRRHARPRLETLAQRIESAVSWDDLVLPENQLGTLREIVAHARQRFVVYEKWAFAARVSRGLGISALFIGPSGTGKTMAAEALANELHLDLFRIDLSRVVSKYIGETEKNLRRVFDAADAGGALLLFDEADALFGKRTEIRDSHDRYANIEVGYLLQRMESYRGLAILTTNQKSALDPAFLRRLRFVVQFPFPDTDSREAIWRRVFPSASPVENLSFDKLAQLNVAGGNIRNIALHAAFLAADKAEPIRMGHLLQAAHSECAKLDRQPGEPEIADWLS